MKKINYTNMKEVEDELWRELNTMERDDVIELLTSYMSKAEKISFVKEWFSSGED